MKPDSKKRKTDNYQWLPVLPSKIVSNTVPLVNYYAINVFDKKTISAVLKQFSASLPFSPCSLHLRRVRVTDGQILILIGPCDNYNSLSDVQVVIRNIIEGEIVISKLSVPQFSPYTRQQYEWCKSHWPVNFREDKRLEKIVNGTFFDEKQLQRMTYYMNLAMQSTEQSTSRVGCVMVNPSDDQVITVTYDITSDTLPLRHAVICAIDLVARSQGGSGDGKSIADDFQWQQTSIKDDAYLCTGLDCYITEEPCTMCAMALVHARIGRVFYAKSNEKYGALGSCLSLHNHKDLNHNFEVFRGLCS